MKNACTINICGTEQNVCDLYVGCKTYVGSKTTANYCDGGSCVLLLSFAVIMLINQSGRSMSKSMSLS